MKTLHNELLINLIIFIISFSYINTHGPCGLDFIKKPNRILLKQEDENRRILQQGEWEPLRIHLDFSYIENNLGRVKKEDLIDLKEKIMPKTQEVFEKLLKVKRIQHKLKLNSPHCETFPIPEKYQQEGVDADIVIFVLIDDSGFFKENKIEAAAIHCLQHFETRRPVAGYIQFKQDLRVNNSTALDYMVWLAVHEITHILVLNDGLYDDYIDSTTLLPFGYDRIIGKKDIKGGKTMKFIKSKNVLEKAKNHFNCKHLEGVPLEYNGGQGTAGSHWSKKFMNTDYMIGDSYGENLISDITLALFEDSGWYQVNFELSNIFLWGKNKGCEFFSKKCVEQDKSNSSSNSITTDFKHEFCTKLNYPLCSIGNVFRATCYAKKFNKDLNIYERHFKDANIGGIDPLTDRCPIAFEDKSGQNYYGGSCRVGNEKDLGSLEKVCPECACFMSTLIEDNSTNNSTLSASKFRLKQNDNLRSINDDQDNVPIIIKPKSSRHFLKNRISNSNDNSTVNVNNYFEEDPNLNQDDPIASCYEFKCEAKTLKVVLNGASYKCPSNEQITIQGYKGFINCPDNEVICHNKFSCKFGCIDKYDNSNPFLIFREEIKINEASMRLEKQNSSLMNETVLENLINKTIINTNNNKNINNSIFNNTIVNNTFINNTIIHNRIINNTFVNNTIHFLKNNNITNNINSTTLNK